MERTPSGPVAREFSELHGWKDLVREPPIGLDQFMHEMFQGVPKTYPSVRWWGNRVARFFENGLFDRALAFEQLCQERREALPWSLLCAYDGRKLSPDRHAAAFWDVLRNHSHLIPAGDLGVALELFPDGGDG